MNIVDRFTRDRVSRFLWGGLMVSFALLLVFALSGERNALREQEREAQARAVHYTETTLFQNLDEELVSGPILRQDQENLLIPVQAEILTNEDVARVRLFDADGTLLFSTDEGDLTTTANVEDSLALSTAIGGETTSSLVRAGAIPRQGLAGSNEDLYETYVPLRVAGSTAIIGAAEIDTRHALLVEAGRSPWRTLEIVFGLGLLLFLGLTVLAFRHSGDPAHVDLAALIKPPRTDPGGDDPVQLRQELAEARDQLLQAEEAYRFLEARSKGKGGEALPASERAELRAALTAAETSGNQARAHLASGARATAGARVRELEEELMQERLRRANAERAARDANRAAEAVGNQRVQELEMEVRTLREWVSADGPADDASEIRSELDQLRRELESTRADAQAAKAEAVRAMRELASVRSETPPAAAAPVPSETPPAAGAPVPSETPEEAVAPVPPEVPEEAVAPVPPEVPEEAVAPVPPEVPVTTEAPADAVAPVRPRQRRSRSGKRRPTAARSTGDASRASQPKPQRARQSASASKRRSPVKDKTSVDDTTTSVDDTTTSVDDKTTAVDEKTTAVDDKTTAVDDKTTAVDEKTSAQPLADDKTTSVDEDPLPANNERRSVKRPQPVQEEPASEVEGSRPSPDDPAAKDLRARLVRTAAAKKPAPHVEDQ